jgi:uncharacterized protein
MSNDPESQTPRPMGRLTSRVAEAIPDAQALYVFGSAAEGRLRADSDLDIAVLGPTPVESLRLFELAQSLTGIAGREVDLVDLRSVPLTLQAQIVGRGRRLATFGPEGAVSFFENQILSRYTAFVEERRVVLEEITRRRAVYVS